MHARFDNRNQTLKAFAHGFTDDILDLLFIFCAHAHLGVISHLAYQAVSSYGALPLS